MTLKSHLSQPARLGRRLNPTQAQQDFWPTKSTSNISCQGTHLYPCAAPIDRGLPAARPSQRCCQPAQGSSQAPRPHRLLHSGLSRCCSWLTAGGHGTSRLALLRVRKKKRKKKKRVRRERIVACSLTMPASPVHSSTLPARANEQAVARAAGTGIGCAADRPLHSHDAVAA